MRITLTQLLALAEEVKTLRAQHLEITRALSAKEAELEALGISLDEDESVEPNGAITPEDWTSPNVVDIPDPLPFPEPEVIVRRPRLTETRGNRGKMYLGTRPRRVRKPVTIRKGEQVLEYMYLNSAYVAYARKVGIGNVVKDGHPRKSGRAVVWLTLAEVEVCAKRSRKPRE